MTPTPTATPATAQNPTPKPDRPLAFQPIQLIGSGSSAPRFTIPEGEAAIALITIDGATNTAVWTISADGSRQAQLVNAIGSYSGTVLFDEVDHSVGFDVQSDGAWSITVRPWSQAFAWDGSASVGGHGDDVVKLTQPAAGSTTVTVTHTGSTSFAVWTYSLAGRDLLVNAAGSFSGELRLAYGTFLLEITAVGDWTISVPA